MTPITQISKNVVTYITPVEVFANGIKIFSWQKFSVITLSISSELLELKVELQNEQDCMGHRNKKLALFRKHKIYCAMAQNAKHYE